MHRWLWMLLFVWGCSEVDSSAEMDLDEAFVEGAAPAFSGKADEAAIGYRALDFTVPPALLRKETRKTITTRLAFHRFFGTWPTQDMTNNWVIFYTPSEVTSAHNLDMTVRLSPTKRGLQVTTSLIAPGENCGETDSAAPYMLVSIPKPAIAASSVRYYADDSEEACAAEGCEHVTQALTVASADLWYMSESDYPFTSVFISGETQVSEAELAAEFGHEGLAVETRDYAEFMERLTTEEDWMDEDSLNEVAKYRVLDAALRENLTNLRVVRFGEIEIHVYMVGETSCGDTAGLKTISIET